VKLKKDGGVSKDQQVYMPCRGCDEGRVHSKLVTIAPKRLKTVRLGHAMTGTAA